MTDPCPDCGRDRTLVGIRHNCNPRPAWVDDEERVPRSPSAVDGAGLRTRIVELEAIIVSLKLELEASKHGHRKDNEYHHAEIEKLKLVTLQNEPAADADLAKAQAKLDTLQRKNKERVAKHRAKKKTND